MAAVAVRDWETIPAPEAALGVALPHSMKGAVAKRRAEFAVGRHCAARALAELRPGRSPAAIGIQANRAPLWPVAIVGAITHCRGFAAAVVAEASCYLGVGRDTEVVLSTTAGGEVRRLVAVGSESVHLAAALALEETTALTLVFSAKESLFKCLAPHVKSFFDFSDAYVSAEPRATALCIELLRPLHAELPKGTRFIVDFLLEESLVHTRCLWRRPSSKSCLR